MQSTKRFTREPVRLAAPAAEGAADDLAPVNRIDGKPMPIEVTESRTIDEVEVTQLPSGFKPYPEGTMIVYHPYRWDEINWFANTRMSEADLFRKILDGIQTLGIERDQITLMDFYYVALLRKVSSLGTTEFTITYTAYDRPQSGLIRFTDIEFVDLDVPALPAVARIHGEEFHFSPMTIGRYLELQAQRLHEDDIAFMAGCVTNLEFTDAYERLKRATGADLLKLEEIDERFFHGIRPLVMRAVYERPNPDFKPDEETTTENYPTLTTREEVSVRLESPDTLIFPYRSPEELDRDGVSFGLHRSAG